MFPQRKGNPFLLIVFLSVVLRRITSCCFTIAFHVTYAVVIDCAAKVYITFTFGDSYTKLKSSFFSMILTILSLSV